MMDSGKRFQHRSKTRALSEHLMGMARDLGPGAKMPTIQELRRELGVSVATLDSALTHLEGQRVIERKHGVGIYVSPHLHQKAIGLICEPAFFRAASPFWQRLIEEVGERAGARGDTFRFYLAIPSGREEVPVHDDLLEDVRAGRIQGALFIGHNKPAVFWLKEQGVPSVAFAGWSECAVQLDYGDLVRQAVAHLVARGCRRLALLVPWEAGVEPPQAPLCSPAAQALQRESAARALPFLPELVWEAGAAGHVESTPQGHEEQGFEGTVRLFAGEGARPDGLISTDDLMTRGALHALAQLGLRAGREVQIASHANRGSDVLRGFESDLAIIEFDPAAVVQAMFEALEALMSGGAAPPQILIAPRLRATEAPLNSRAP